MLFRTFIGLSLIIVMPSFGTDAGTIQSMLQSAILKDSASDVNSAIKAGAKVNLEKPSQAPLLKAVLLKKFNATDALLKAEANPNIYYGKEKLVHYLIKQSELEPAKAFVNANADFSGLIDDKQDAFTYVSSHFNTPVQGKSTQSYFDLMYSMIKHGYDLKINFTNAIMSI